MSLSNLPLKPYYSLSEAENLLRSNIERPDINENYFLTMGIIGDLRIAIKPSFKSEDEIGCIFYEDLERINNIHNNLEQAQIISLIAMTFDGPDVLLTLDKEDLSNIFHYRSINLSEIVFNNVYSLKNHKFYISDEYSNELDGFKYSDKLSVQKLYSPAAGLKKQNKLVLAPQDKHGNYLYPEECNQEDDWQTLFAPSLNVANYSDEEIFSHRIISLDDLYIFGEDLEQLIKGNKKEEQRHQVSKDKALNSRRESSLLQIIYALAHNLSLNLEEPQKSYNKLARYCQLQDIELPKKDTVGEIFKKAAEKNKF